MDWLRSVAVGIITAAAGGAGAGWLAHLCIGWYRISSREGASGCFLVAVAGFGCLAGFAVGLICARVVAAGASAGFFRELGLALGVTAALLGLAALFCRQGADRPPTLDGRELDVEIEVRLPAGQAPQPLRDDDIPPYVTITADSGGRHQTSGPLRVADAWLEEGRWIVPGAVALETSDPGKTLGVRLPGQETQFFRLPLPARPDPAVMGWSPWLDEPTFGNLTPVASEAALAVRCRVRVTEPDPDAPAQ